VHWGLGERESRMSALQEGGGYAACLAVEGVNAVQCHRLRRRFISL